MMEIELQSFDTRLGKFEGVQLQHDQRLAEIERRLGTIEKLISDFRVEVDGKQEALRSEFSKNQEALRSELLNIIQNLKSEMVEMVNVTNQRIESTNQRIETTNQRIDSVRSELLGRIESVRTELSTEISKLGDRLSDKIDAQYKWFLGVLVTIAIAVIAAIIRGYLK